MYKNSKYTVLFPLLLAAGVVLGLLLGQYMGRNSTTSEIKGMLRQMALPTNKLTYTLSLIENQYVDSVAMDSLAEHVIPLLVKELDPHSVYIPASEMQEINEPLEGEFDGIGVVFNMATDTVIVLNVIPQGPSDKAGIKAGDRIIEINDTLVAGQKIPQRDVVKKLRPARHDRTPRAGTPGYLRPGGRRRRARQESDQKRRIGVLHCRRHRLHQAGTVRPDDLR